VFGENQRAVRENVEHAATASFEFDREGTFGCQIVRQTGGSRVVVSNPAIVDANIHGQPPASF
jgi:hypothetical protein